MSDVQDLMMWYVDNVGSDHDQELIYLERGQWFNAQGEEIEEDFDLESLVETDDIWIPDFKEDHREISAFLNNQNCQGFYHFTDVTNLRTIFREGFIASRNLATDLNLMSVDTEGDISTYNNTVCFAQDITNQYVDWNTTMHVRDFARFNIQSNNPIQYRWEGIDDTRNGNTQVPQPCIIKVSKEIAEVSDVFFSETNANSTMQEYGQRAEHIQRIPVHSLQYSRNCNTYERGAEVLYPRGIPVNFIEEIYFRSIGEYKHARNLVKKRKWREKFKRDNSPFSSRSGSKNPTMLNSVWLTNISLQGIRRERSWLYRPRSDVKEFRRGETINFIFNMANRNPNYITSVELYQGRGRRLTRVFQEETRGFQALPTNLHGNYTLKLKLEENGRTHTLYTVKFEVA
jgi:hypothetical protein